MTMAIRKILEFPDPRLRTRAASVEVVDERIQTLIDDMFETMYDANGIGLAASQIDVHEQVIVPFQRSINPTGVCQSKGRSHRRDSRRL